MNDSVIARLTNDGEAKLIRSLLETYGIPSTINYDVSNIVYPINVGEIRVSVPEGLEDEAMGILQAHRSRIPGPKVSALSASPSLPVPFPTPLSSRAEGDDEDEEDDDDDEDDLDDDEEEDDGLLVDEDDDLEGDEE